MKTGMIVPTACIDHILEVLPVRRGVGHQRLNSAPVRMCTCADRRQEANGSVCGGRSSVGLFWVYKL